MLIKMWESQDGAAITLIDGRDQNPGRPVKVELLSEDDGEFVGHLSVTDLKRLMNFIEEFIQELP